MIKNLSPSRASQFKTCPKQFKFSNVDKIKEPTNLVQAKGTTVHQALEDLYSLPSEERTSDTMLTFLTQLKKRESGVKKVSIYYITI